MRRTLSTVVLGISLLAPACAKKSYDSSSKADVEHAADRGATEEGKMGAPPAYKADPAAGAGSAAAPAPSTAVAPGAIGAGQAAASVRAGERDDNANYRDYAKWLETMPKNIARLDIANRQFLVVEDKDGKLVLNCKLAITGGQQMTTLVTTRPVAPSCSRARSESRPTASRSPPRVPVRRPRRQTSASRSSTPSTSSG
jgi:hypothetical protein